MLTAKEVLKSNWINQKGYQSYEWVLTNEHIIKAMKEYAAQFIELAVEEAITDIDKESILNLKKEIQ